MIAKAKFFFLFFLLGYLIFFVIGFTLEPQKRQIVYQEESYAYQDSFSSGSLFDFNVGRKNYASSKLKIQDNRGSHFVDQKYEKIASIGSITGEYESDEEKLRKYISVSKSLIQYEQKSGTEEDRILQLAIGVHPNDFDALVENFKTIGKLESFQSDITDKTNEFNKLKAEREKLTQHMEALQALKGRSGKVEELIALEVKILSVQDQLQNLGVSLGDFDNENEFRTVKFILKEDLNVAPVVDEPGIMDRIIDALSWATGKYFFFLVMFSIAAVGLWGTVKLVNQLKLIENLIRKKKE